MLLTRWTLLGWRGTSVAEGHAPGPMADSPEPAAPLTAAEPPAAGTQLDPARQQLARRYARQREVLSLVDLLVSAIIVVLLLITPLGFALRDALAPAAAWQPFAHWAPLQVAAYFGVLYAAFFVLGLPLAFYSGYTLPHRYDLATQPLGGWVVDLVKGQALSLVFLLAAVEFVYAVLALLPDYWWLVVGGALLVVTALLANLAPVLLLPLFYKLTPLPDGDHDDLRTRILALAARTHTRVQGVYTMNMSSRTRAANAFVIGLGNTRRIVIGDTLLSEFAPDEIEVVVAHELGHQVHRDIPKLIGVQFAITLGGLYLVNLVLHAVVGAVPGYHGLADAATMPLVAAALGVFGLVTMPLTNGFSRWVEHRADVFALDLTHDTTALIGAMTRLANQNLAELQPAPWIEWLLYDHPSLGRRIAYARGYAARLAQAPGVGA